MRKLIAASFFASAALAGEASQDDFTNLSIEELLNLEIISASRLGPKTSQAPTSVSILTAKDIRTFGWRTLAEALNSLRGLFTSSDRNYSFLGARGFMRSGDYNSRILLMIDGQRLNENIYDGGYIAQEFMLDMDLVDHIEYVPGSGSSIYGANAFLGMINIVTKQGQAINGAQVAGEIGTFDTYKGRVSYGKSLDNGADVLFSASHFDSAGVENLYFPGFDTPETNRGVAHNMDDERADRLFGKFKFEEFTLSGGYVNRFKRVPTASFDGIFNDQQFFTEDKQFFTNLKYEKNVSDTAKLQLKGYYQGYDYHADQAYLLDGSRVINHDFASGRWWGGEAQLTFSPINGHRMILGLEYQYDQRQALTNHDIDPYFSYVRSRRSGHRLEAYLQDDIQILDDLIFSAGARVDYHHMLNSMQANPRLGLIWSPLANTQFKLLYSSTFRAPNSWERDYNAFGFVANPDMREEQIKSYEGIVEWRSANGLRLLGSLFHNDISQLLMGRPATADIDGDYSVQNYGRYHAYGIELEGEKRWSSGRLLKASYTYNLLTNENSHGTWATYSPQNLFKLHYAESFFNDYLTLGIENIFIDRRKLDYAGSFGDGYNLVNINLSSDKLIRGLDTSFGIYNLFDIHPQMPGVSDQVDIIRMNGRELRLKLQLTF
ncbi:TonB-dependent receptor plug domain-containing protein [Methylomonas koyamae]|uniref:TonB-dependent receptor n=1 Tax=Methylomonas koyamae TaxID=702114 RepID=A0A291IKP9_9GAMM|nr:TonB-dependent receptor [Methylomonas koyamae]ATG90849.1 TonB-dependent receptor [Methylomonas koyamae]OAI24299.1 TonB-dependent receptor [Methylomonas koyamae]